jgi:hypothetical protein
MLNLHRQTELRVIRRIEAHEAYRDPHGRRANLFNPPTDYRQERNKTRREHRARERNFREALRIF